MATGPETPIAVAVVRQSGRVLIGKRPPEAPLGGLWEFPGGKVCQGERPEAAAVRECREETGLEIRLEGPCQVVVFPYHHGRLRILFFLARPAGESTVARALVPLDAALRSWPDIAFRRPINPVLHRLLEGDWKDER